VSLPFSDMCEPLFIDPNQFQCAFKELAQFGRNKQWRYIELRGGKKWLATSPAYASIYTHEIDLEKEEKELFASLRDSTRRNIQIAEKNGISVTHSTSLQALQAFYRLNCLTRREHGIPPQPWKFFLNLWNIALKHDKGFITLASYNTKAIAANLYLVHGKNALYKYGASDRGYQHLRASNLVMWEGIKKCREMGCRTLNLGRTEPQHKGLLQYKRGFGCKEITVNYYRFNIRQHRFTEGPRPKKNQGLPTRIMSKLPIPLLKLAGKILYKYVG
jgi:lipid II:glycine glycyltransferase (peptidoglycan interpeptide bridge formation enzyme)